MTTATPLQPGSLVTYTRVPDEEGNHLDPETMAAYVEGLGLLIYLGPSPDPQIAEDGIGRVWVPEMGAPGRYRGGPWECEIEGLTAVAVPVPDWQALAAHGLRGWQCRYCRHIGTLPFEAGAHAERREALTHETRCPQNPSA